MLLLESFSSLWQLAFKGPPLLVLLCCVVQQAFKDLPVAGVLLYCLKGHHLWGLYWSVSCTGSWGEREATVMAPSPAHDSAVLPWLYDCLVFLKGIPHCDLLPHIPSASLPAVNSRPHPGIAPQSLHSSSQPPCVLEDLHSCLGYIWMRQGSSVGFSLHSDCHRSIAALSKSLKCFPASQTMPQVVIWPLLQFPHPPNTDPVLLTLLFFTSFLHPTKFYVDLYIPFQGSGTPACSQLVFWKICIWRCIPETFVEMYSMSTTPLPSCLPPSIGLFLDGYRWN